MRTKDSVRIRSLLCVGCWFAQSGLGHEVVLDSLYQEEVLGHWEHN
jgi:hypothetical protein